MKHTFHFTGTSRRNLVLASLFLVLFAGRTAGQTSCAAWANTGTAGFSSGTAVGIHMAIDGSAVPYVSYTDGANSNKVTVKKYTGSTWATVGSSGFSSAAVDNPIIAFDGNTPYVVFRSSSLPTVMKYNGSTWAIVGSAGFSAGTMQYHDIAIDNSGTPYVVYRDNANGGKATVKKYNGSSWVTVGTAGFSAGQANGTRITMSGTTPYVAYTDLANSNKTTVKRFNGTSWVTVGSVGFSTGVATNVGIVITGGTPYVCYNDDAISNKTVVKKYDGTSWVNVGIEGFSTANAVEAAIAINSSGTPYVTYSDDSFNGKTTVMKYNGSSWVTTGSAGFSAGGVGSLSIAIGSGDVPYVAYKDVANSNKATVMQLNAASLAAITGTTSVAVGAATSLSNATPGVKWSSSNTSVAPINAAGVVSGAGAGTATISCTYSSMCGTLMTTANVTVSATGGAYCHKMVATGSSGFSPSGVALAEVAIDTANTPYVTFVPSDGQVTVMKFSGGSWARVDTSVATGADVHIVIGSNNLPIVTFRENSIAGKAMKYDGTNWINMGYFTTNATHYNHLAIDASGTPYVSYPDSLYGYKLRVKKFTGSTWAAVGSGGISAGAAVGPVAIDPSETPYVAFQDSLYGYKATVKKYDGSSWVTVGSAGFSAGSTGPVSLALAGDGTPYVSYIDDVANGITVMKYDGSTWNVVGSSGFAGLAAYSAKLITDQYGTPYVAFEDVSHGSEATLMKFDGSSWVTVDAGFTGEVANDPDVAIGKNDVIYTSYSEISSFTASVMQLDITLVPTITGVTTVAVAGTTTLSDALSGGTWSSSNTAKATVGSATGVVTGVAAGSAVITYTVPSGCYATATVTVTSPKPGISNSAETAIPDIQLYPNPTSGNFVLSTPAAGTLSIHTLDGRLVHEYAIAGTSSVISMPACLAAGIYIGRFISNDGNSRIVRITYQP